MNQAIPYGAGATIKSPEADLACPAKNLWKEITRSHQNSP